MSLPKGHLILVRGLPGSGKSTFARTLVKAGYEHVETDMWHTDAEGNYRFDGSKLAEYHRYCQETTAYMLAEGRNVVVSNTFVKRWELQPYLEMGAASVTIVEMPTVYGNVHGVPAGVVERMAKSWERVDAEFIARHRKV